MSNALAKSKKTPSPLNLRRHSAFAQWAKMVFLWTLGSKMALDYHLKVAEWLRARWKHKWKTK